MEKGCQLVDFHDLRTRKAGNQRYVELHLTMPRSVSVEDAHRVCDRLEHGIEARLANVSVTIHVEPCIIECEQCSVSCTLGDKNK